MRNVQVLKDDFALDIEKMFELRRLSTTDKEIIVYGCLEDKTYPQIAELLFIDIAIARRKLDNIILEVGIKSMKLSKNL